MTYVLGIQVASFIALGGLFLAMGQWRLGLAQCLLAVIQGLIYTGRF